MPELRKNPISGRWVIIAAEREKRPRQFQQTVETTQPEPCPFCTGNETMTPPEVMSHRDSASLPNSPGWTLRVVSNKYPALISTVGQIPRHHPLSESRESIGVHEVIIESPEHVVNMGALSVEQITLIFRTYRERMRAVQEDSRWRYILVYKNHGDRAGATLEHIHSQLIALPAVPEQALGELSSIRKHYVLTGRCLYCEMIREEINLRERLVLDSERFAVFCPFAPRFAYETWILPKDHSAAFERSSDPEISDLGSVFHELIAKLNLSLDDPPFNFLIHTMPPREQERDHYHWHIEILPQVARAAGFEWGTGMHINSVAPEDAARLLRNAAV